MIIARRTVGGLLVGAGALLLSLPGARVEARGQEQAPTRREFTIVAKDFRYLPDRIDVAQDDLVKLTLRSGDVAYAFMLDEYRIARRVPAGGATTFEFRADRPGTFPFYCNLTSEPDYAQMRGQLVVRPR